MMRDHFATEAGDLRFTAQHAPEHDTASQTIRSLMQLAIVGVLIGVLLFHNVKLPVTVAGLIVILLLWLVGRTSATPLLVAFQLVLFFREPGRVGPSNDLDSVLFIVVVVGLLMFLSQDQTLDRLVSRRVADLFRSLFAKRHDHPEAMSFETSHPPSSSPDRRQSSALVRQVATLVICVLMAQLLLVKFAIPGGVERGDRPFPEAKGMLEAAPILLVFTIAAVIAMAELAWKRLTVEQASMFIRSTQIQLLYADIRMIVRSRLTARRRRKRAASALPPPSIPLPVESP